MIFYWCHHHELGDQMLSQILWYLIATYYLANTGQLHGTGRCYKLYHTGLYWVKISLLQSELITSLSVGHICGARRRIIHNYSANLNWQIHIKVILKVKKKNNLIHIKKKKKKSNQMLVPKMIEQPQLSSLLWNTYKLWTPALQQSTTLAGEQPVPCTVV